MEVGGGKDVEMMAVYGLRNEDRRGGGKWRLHVVDWIVILNS